MGNFGNMGNIAEGCPRERQSPTVFYYLLIKKIYISRVWKVSPVGGGGAFRKVPEVPEVPDLPEVPAVTCPPALLVKSDGRRFETRFPMPVPAYPATLAARQSIPGPGLDLRRPPVGLPHIAVVLLHL